MFPLSDAALTKHSFFIEMVGTDRASALPTFPTRTGTDFSTTGPACSGDEVCAVVLMLNIDMLGDISRYHGVLT